MRLRSTSSVTTSSVLEVRDQHLRHASIEFGVVVAVARHRVGLENPPFIRADPEVPPGKCQAERPRRRADTIGDFLLERQRLEDRLAVHPVVRSFRAYA